MKVLLVKPNEYAVETEIENSLKAIQQAVGGHFEIFPANNDPAVYVLNEAGKIMGLEDNRAIYDRNGNFLDILTGTFFVCGVDGDDFTGLSPGLMEKYKNQFYEPELFVEEGGKIRAVKASDPEMKNILSQLGMEPPWGAAPVPPMPEVYKYYSTQRPVSPGTFPRTDSGPSRIVNFDQRQPVENGQFAAWGYLEYTYPLKKQQAEDYELRPAPDNELLRKRVYEQAQTVGKWEKSHRINEVKRLTWHVGGSGEFFPKPHVTPGQLDQRYSEVMEAKARMAEKRAANKPIAERLDEGAAQAARDNADKPAPADDKDKEERS